MAAAPENLLPFEHLDKACLAATSAADGLSNAPTWALRVEGALDVAALRRAVDDLLFAYPSAGARARRLDPAGRRWAWELPVDDAEREAAVAVIVTVHLPAAAAAAAALGDAIRDRALDLETGPPLRVDWQPDADGEAGWLYVQQHHGLADGRAFIGLLVRLFALLDARARGVPPDAALTVASARRPELEALALSGGRRRRWTLRGAWIYLRGALMGLVAPTTPLWQNRSADYRGGNRTLHLPLTAARQAALRRAAEAIGANLHAALLTAWVRASARLSAERGVDAPRLMLASIVELRPRLSSGAAAFDSFANHLGWVLPALDLRRAPTFAAACAVLHAEMRRQLQRGEVAQRYLFERWGLRALPIDGVRAQLARPRRAVVQCNASNVLAIPIPTLATAALRVTAVHVTTPVSPPYGALLTITSYADEATLNVNIKDSVVDLAAGARLAVLLDDELAGFAASAPPPTDATR